METKGTNIYACVCLYTIPYRDRRRRNKRRNNIVKGLLTGRRRFVPVVFCARTRNPKLIHCTYNEQSMCVCVCASGAG